MATSRKAKAKPAVRYSLRIELAEITPVIWRQVWVEGHIRLVQLHHTIQAAMGWSDAHLHAFKIGDTRYGTPDPEVIRITPLPTNAPSDWIRSSPPVCASNTI